MTALKLRGWDCVFSIRSTPCLKASKARPWGLWGLSHSSHKNRRRRGPGYLRVGDTPAHPLLMSRSVTLTSSGCSPPAGQSHTSSRWQRASFPSILPNWTTFLLDTRAEIHSFPPRGKRRSRPGLSVLPKVPPPPTLTGCSSTCPCLHLAPSENLTPLGLPSSHLPLCPTCLGSHPWGLLLCFPQARNFYSDHQCLFLMRSCVVVMMMMMMVVDSVPGTLQLLIHIIQTFCYIEHD